MNPIINHFNIQEIKMQTAAIKELVEKIGFPSGLIQDTKEFAIKIKEAVENLESKTINVSSTANEIKLQATELFLEIGDIEQRLEVAIRGIGFIVQIAIAAVVLLIFNLGALAWLIVKLYR